MNKHTANTEKHLNEDAVSDRFLDDPCEGSFTALFNVFAPQLIAFFRARSRQYALAEDLTQEVMLKVYQKAGQLRDRTLFRAWLFKIAQNTLRQHYGRARREVETVNLADVANRVEVAGNHTAGTPGFEFRNWMDFLDPREREVMRLRFIEQWEYHEIAAARSTPIGTVQWRVFNSKKKLAGHLASRNSVTPIARNGKTLRLVSEPVRKAS
jgi:RNA polymerase sigma-70 factor (ECF subfamily)